MDRAPPVIVLGLDSIPPTLLFERFLPRMPNLRAILQTGVRGTLRSCDPPITVPAWAVMFTGCDPGTLGLYGFRHRFPGEYFRMYTPTPRHVHRPMLWELASRAGKRVAVIGMEPSYPPPAVNGVYVSGFLAPDDSTDFVTPSSLLEEVQRVSGGYQFDVTFRSEDRARIGEELFEMTRRRWKLARHLLQKERWDLFALHEIGPDRLHHTFWKYFDRDHPHFVPDSPFAKVVEEYYALLDREIGELNRLLPPDAILLIASDHGSQAMAGGFCINEWLLQHGYLALKRAPPSGGAPLESVEVDWSRTSVWGAGGYYARLFVNQCGREPHGIVRAADVPALRAKIERGLSEVRTPAGGLLGVRLFAPQEVYRSVQGDPPDWMAYFGDVRWRSAGTVGHGRTFLEENDTGPDDAVHSFDGLFLFKDGRDRGGCQSGPRSILDVAPTLMTRMGLPVPPHVQGQIIADWL